MPPNEILALFLINMHRLGRKSHIGGSIRSQERGQGSKVGWCVSVPRLMVFVGLQGWAERLW
jgi:hypothetical protein